MMQINTKPTLEPYLITLIDRSTSSAEDLDVEEFTYALVVESSPSAAINIFTNNLRDGVQVAGILGLGELKEKLGRMETMDLSQPTIEFDLDDWKSATCPY